MCGSADVSQMCSHLYMENVTLSLGVHLPGTLLGEGVPS